MTTMTEPAPTGRGATFDLGAVDREMPPRGLLVLEKGLRHDVEATEESAFLLTLGWKGR